MRRCVLTALAAALLAAPAADASVSTLEVVGAGGGPTTVVARDAQRLSSGYGFLAWSPDGLSLISSRETVGRRRIVAEAVRLPVAGGAPVVLGRIHGQAGSAVDPTGAWSAEVVDWGDDRPAGVEIRNVATRRMTVRVDERSEGDELYESGPEVIWSPNGRFVAVNGMGRNRASVLRVVEAATGRVLVNRRATWGGAMAFSPDGQRLLLSRSGTMVVLDLATGARRSLPPWFREYRGAKWSPDGSRLALKTAEDGIAVIDAVTGWGKAIPVAQREIFQIGAIDWSPDGRSIAYVVSRDDDEREPDSIAVVAADGSAPPQTLLTRQGAFYDLDWSPAGDRIAFAFSRLSP